MSTTLPVQPAAAVLPLVGNQQTDEMRWLGALLARLLGDLLAGAGRPVMDYNSVVGWLTSGSHALPLEAPKLEKLRRDLRVDAVIHGRFVLDEDRMLGLSLLVDAPQAPLIPLEMSAPLSSFPVFMTRAGLALLEQLGQPIDEAVRQKVGSVRMPVGFETVRQLARAYAAWARAQNELALAAVTSALSLDPDLEEAAALEAAIAQTAGDTATTRQAYRRWADIGKRRGSPQGAAERLLLLGHWLARRGEWDEARRAYEDSRSAFLQQGDEQGQARAINNIANLEMMRGHYQNAIQAYRRGMRTFEGRAESAEDRIRSLYNLALAHRNLGQQDEAGRAVEQAIGEARRLQQTHLEALCLALRGTLHEDAGRWTQADLDYSQAARLLDVLGDDRAVAAIWVQQAGLLRRQGETVRAEKLMTKAAAILEAGEDPFARGVAWLNLGNLYLLTGDYESAWDYGQRAADVFEELGAAYLDRARDLLAVLETIPDSDLADETAAPDLSGSAGDARSVPAIPTLFGSPGFASPAAPADLGDAPGEDADELAGSAEDEPE